MCVCVCVMKSFIIFILKLEYNSKIKQNTWLYPTSSVDYKTKILLSQPHKSSIFVLHKTMSHTWTQNTDLLTYPKPVVYSRLLFALRF